VEKSAFFPADGSKTVFRVAIFQLLTGHIFSRLGTACRSQVNTLYRDEGIARKILKYGRGY